MTLSEFERVSYKILGPGLSGSGTVRKMREDIRRSHMGLRAEAYLASSIFIAGFAGAGAFFVSLFVVFVVLPLVGVNLPAIALVLVPVAGAAVGGATYMILASMPANKAKARAKDIDMRLPYALNYIAAMASAGVNLDEVFHSLATQKVYGEVAKEAEWIYRDMVYFGKDSVTAMKRAIARSPSDRFQEFLQGAITTVTSGGDLQNYFSAKAQRYMWENRQNQKQFIDMMGLMAETYVTAVVAGPLFLIVMMAIMGMLGGQGPTQLYLVVYLLLPIANGGFVFALKAMTPEI
ncbi:MAG: type II secretion system F family protein [Thermoplasmatota archaeon]